MWLFVHQKTSGINPQLYTVTGSGSGVSPLLCVHHMRRSSLGSGRGRPGFSDPADPVCFFSSALGLYVPSILLFFLMRHSSSSTTRLSTDSTVNTNTDTVGEINTCIAMVTDSFLRTENIARPVFLHRDQHSISWIEMTVGHHK